MCSFVIRKLYLNNAGLIKGRLNGHEFEQTPRDSEGQGSLLCYSPWGHKESDITLPTNVRLVKTMVSPVVTYGCES